MAKLLKPIPDQVINELAAFRPFDLKPFFDLTVTDQPRFMAEIKGGDSLPKGMILTSDGILTGIPGRNTQGIFDIDVSLDIAGTVEKTTFKLTIKPSLVDQSDLNFLNNLKTQIWEALEKRLPVPNLTEFYERPFNEMDLYYLLERWGTLTIWDAFNLEPAGEKRILNLKDASPHYFIYDRGSCIIGVPKDLYNHERTVLDGMMTARAMAREVYKRNWTIEMAGVDKYTRAAWVEVQHLSDKYGKSLDILNFNPTPDDVKIYSAEAQTIRMKGGETL